LFSPVFSGFFAYFGRQTSFLLAYKGKQLIPYGLFLAKSVQPDGSFLTPEPG
jgi:hypothetical protein